MTTKVTVIIENGLILDPQVDVIGVDDTSFANLPFVKTSAGRRAQVRFSNGYGASVIFNVYSTSGAEGLYEVAVTDKNGRLMYDTPVTPDVVAYCDESDVERVLQQIVALPSQVYSED
jgi:hypothetical protein